MWPGYAAEIARQTSPVSSVRQSERACRSQVSAKKIYSVLIGLSITSQVASAAMSFRHSLSSGARSSAAIVMM